MCRRTHHLLKRISRSTEVSNMRRLALMICLVAFVPFSGSTPVEEGPLKDGRSSVMDVPAKNREESAIPLAQNVSPKRSSGILPLSPESYVDKSRIWKRKPIPVCWETSALSFSDEVAWVEFAVHEVIEKASSVRFIGIPSSPTRWPTCSEGSIGIRIGVSTSQPRSEVGQQWAVDSEGTRVEKPTRMRLNFGTGRYKSVCEGQRRECIAYIAVHEFAHAIGFLHEHLREDAPSVCKENFKHDPDDPGYEPVRVSMQFDHQSITNYCRAVFQRPMPPTKLSNYDILAINHFYPKY